MFLVCGEALMDVFAERDTSTGVALDARVGGSPFNVAIGLARLGQSVGFLGALSDGFLGQRLRRALTAEGVDLRWAPVVDAPTTLGLVGLDASGSPSYGFYGHGGADRQLHVEHLPLLDGAVKAMHFGSYSMVVGPVGATQRALVERERRTRLIAYDPNVRLNVEPDMRCWTDTVTWMASRVHLLKISSEDIELLHPGVPLQDVVDRWLGAGVSVVVVTEGGRGAQSFTRRGAMRVDASAVQVVDTVGAGDTFQAALLAWLSEHGLLSIGALASVSGQQLRGAMEFASGAATITCTRRGADLPRRAELC